MSQLATLARSSNAAIAHCKVPDLKGSLPMDSLPLVKRVWSLAPPRAEKVVARIARLWRQHIEDTERRGGSKKAVFLIL
eukprot:s1152_g10.t1